MIGAIIGDIIGSRFEFNNYRDTDFELFTPECDFTDDTVCTVAIADAIIKGIPFGDSLHSWCRKYPNPKGGYGGSFAHWVWDDNPHPYNSFGNGSAMRVSPVAWAYNSWPMMQSEAIKTAECTHSHSEGIRGAVCVADCVFHARHGSGMFKIIELVTKKYGYDIDTTCKEIRKTNSLYEACQVTVPQAIICFLESTDFESAIRLAVSIGGDSDTIAAITGSIAEAYYGVPEHIKDRAFEYLPQEFIYIIDRFKQRIDERL